MLYHRAPKRSITKRVEAFTVPSGLGVFTVSIVEKTNDGRVLVRINSPVHYPDWDGKRFKVKSEDIRLTKKWIIIPLEDGNVRLAG